MTQLAYLNNHKASERFPVKEEKVIKPGREMGARDEGIVSKLDLNLTLKALESG